jgi:Fe-S cluster assembly protein SufD
MENTKKTYYPLENVLINHFAEHVAEWEKNDLPEVTSQRKGAMEYFKKKGFPNLKMEKWRGTDMDAVYQEELTVFDEETPFDKKVDEIFECEVHGFHTRMISVLNGSYYSKEEAKLTVNPEGVIIGSLARAQKAYPELFEKYYGKLPNHIEDGFKAINTAMARDGAFVYIPDGVELSGDTLQLIDILNKPNLVVNTRNLIVLGKNAKLSFLHCDDSVNHHAGLINTVSEIYVGENAQLELYKLQNINDETALVNQVFIDQAANSHVKINVLTLNGGMIRNEVSDALNGEEASCDIRGLYLVDKEQHIDNHVTVLHNAPRCNSNQLFKGVLDNKATGVFNGFTYVKKDAQQTNAFQKNSNILLSDSARIDAMPHLEIYADDVKCGHGASVGQLDNEALFYLMQRGIPFEDARMLLMYAFADDILKEVTIDALRITIEDMVKRRLRGELSICDRCVLHCSNPEQPIIFDIDLSKI